MTAKDATRPGRPNILMIVSDDQGHWAMNCAGTPEIETPNLDRLAGMGKRLTSLYCVSPVCSPARASLLPGRIPSAHGVHDWIRAGNAAIETDYHNRLIDYLDRSPTYVEILADAGINRKINPDTWKTVVSKLTAGIRQGQRCPAICAAIRETGDLLRHHFPHQRDDRDELHNLIIR